MTQRIIATRSSSIIEKRKLIAAYLLEHPEGCTPKMIAIGTSLNVNTVKSILPKLSNITTIARGLYKVLNTPHTLPVSCGDLDRWNFHNLVLSVELQSYVKHSCSLDYDLIKLAINISDTGYCSIHVSTDYPINVSSICLLFGLIKSYLKEYSADELTPSRVRVNTIEFNQDHSNLKLDGVNCITLDNLTAQFKLYQKDIGLRIEHKTKIGFNVDNMIDMLTGSSASVDVSNRMTETIKRLDKLTGQTVYNTALLNQLLVAKNGG